MFAALLSGAVALCARADQPEPASANTNYLPGLCFPLGEELVYRIYWGIIPVGETRSKFEQIEEHGKKRLAIRYKTRTNAFFDTIYPVNDKSEAILDPATFLPEHATISLGRRKGTTESHITFDYTKLVAHLVSTNAAKTKDCVIAHDTRDILSFSYYLRTVPLVPGTTNNYRFVTDAGLIDMVLKVYKEEEVDLSDFGKMKCLRIEPKADLTGFLIENGVVTSWVSRERNVCTKMKIKAPLASVTVELSEVNGPGDDFWSKLMQKRKHDEKKNGSDK